jgi:hypothetical protein
MRKLVPMATREAQRGGDLLMAAAPAFAVRGSTALGWDAFTVGVSQRRLHGTALREHKQIDMA